MNCLLAGVFKLLATSERLYENPFLSNDSPPWRSRQGSTMWMKQRFSFTGDGNPKAGIVGSGLWLKQQRNNSACKIALNTITTLKEKALRIQISKIKTWAQQQM